MKKLLLIPILFLITLSQVSAEDLNSNIAQLKVHQFCPELVSSCTRANIKSYYESYASEITNLFSDAYNLYSSSYSQSYPYYIASLSFIINNNELAGIELTFLLNSSLPTLTFSSYMSPITFEAQISTKYLYSSYTSSSFTIGESSSAFYYNDNDNGNSNMGSIYNYNLYFLSNFDLRWSDLILTGIDSIGYKFYDFNSIEFIYQVGITSNIIPTLYDTLELDFLSEYDTNTYTEINLNDYEYIILSFKDYNNLISPIQFDYIGQPCFTQVNGYGTIDRTSTSRCSIYSSSWTKSALYPNSSTLQDKAVYYLVPYNINQENKVKINTRVFNINYITSANSNNPTVDVNGRSYPAIPYSNLGNSTTDNEDNNYIPGQSENIWDTTTDSDFWSNLFQHPLQALQNVWSAITTMFALVGSFIGLLPQTLQSFLIASFSMGIVLGLLKIIL